MLRIPFDKEVFGDLEAEEEVELMALATLSPDGEYLIISDVEGQEPEYVEEEEEVEEKEDDDKEEEIEDKEFFDKMLPSKPVM